MQQISQIIFCAFIGRHPQHAHATEGSPVGSPQLRSDCMTSEIERPMRRKAEAFGSIIPFGISLTHCALARRKSGSKAPTFNVSHTLTTGIARRS